MKDLNDILYGRDFEPDENGLLLPPGTKRDSLYELEGGPRHATRPNSLYYITRQTQDRGLNLTFGPVSGFEIRGDKVYRWIDGEKVEQRGLDAIRLRAQARGIFGEAIADAAGIEPE